MSKPKLDASTDCDAILNKVGTSTVEVRESWTSQGLHPFVVGPRRRGLPHPMPIPDWHRKWDDYAFRGLQDCGYMDIEWTVGEDEETLELATKRAQTWTQATLTRWLSLGPLTVVLSYIQGQRNRDVDILGDSKAHLPDLVREVYAYRSGVNDNDDWILIGRLQHGLYFYFYAGCCYTGFDVIGHINLVLASTYEILYQWGMDTYLNVALGPLNAWPKLHVVPIVHHKRKFEVANPPQLSLSHVSKRLRVVPKQKTIVTRSPTSSLSLLFTAQDSL